MKIFCWLNRRLHTNMEYCRVPHHSKDAYVHDGTSADHGAKKAGTEKEALLLDPNVTSIQHVLDGILTIGTLGHLDGHCHEALGAAAGLPQEFPSGTSAFKAEEEKEEEEEEGGGGGLPVELAPSAEHLTQRPAIGSFRKEVALMEEDNVKNISLQVERDVADEEEVLLEPLLGEIVQVDRRERVTLADLLAAEAHLHMTEKAADPTGRKSASASAKTALEKAANGAAKMSMIGASLSFRGKQSPATLNKKLGPWKKDSPAANGKLHQKIRRMLKKKIHPEMARDVQARGGEQGSHDQPYSVI